jgi:hypothetical protein
MKTKIILFVSFLLVNSASYANPDAIVIPNGDVRIKGTGSGLVFPDGSVQYKAVDLNTFYTNSQITDLIQSYNVLVSMLPPTIIQASATGTTINLSWNPISQARSYNLYWGTSPGLTKNSIKISNLTDLTYEHSGLIRGSVYYYAITANVGISEGKLSPEVFIQVPYAQANLTRELEPNSTTDTANQIVIGGGSFKGQLSRGFISSTNTGDFDYYAFDSIGGVVQFYISTDGSSGLNLFSIIGLDGVTVLASIPVTSFTNSKPQTLSVNTTSGRYYILVSPKFSCTTGGGCNYNEIFQGDYSVTPSYSYGKWAPRYFEWVMGGSRVRL